MKIRHISITARDAIALARFYVEVFGLEERRAAKRLSGELISRGNGLPNTEVLSIWLNAPDQSEPFLELMEYDEPLCRGEPAVNEPGFGHIAIRVSNIDDTIQAILKNGGSMQGEVVNLGTIENPIKLVYIRDLEGNILELEETK
ncbi:VOC family protein [Cognatishimia sp. D5M38]|uniref:VOC family protein n=1 Tax=Cognatishimia coralii TaxID=3083254 RepID=A0ABU8QKQ1_9RHOB